MKWLRYAALAALIAVWVLPAHAQQTRKLEVRDGRVYVDGKQLKGDQLPPDLNVGDVTLLYTFTSDAEPYVTIDNRVYQLKANRLMFIGDAPASRFFFSAPSQVRLRTARLADLDSMLAGQAMRVYDLTGKLLDETEVKSALHEAQVSRLSRQLASEAERMNVVVRQRPVLEREQYFSTIAANDEHRRRLQRENELEARSFALANQLRQSSDAGEKRRLARELEALLEDIFELKQQNRRDEIDQVEEKLEALQAQLRERERLKKQIIEKRLNELTGKTRW